MSALAKVFVVFVFILSVAFFGTSATLFKTRLDWKSAYTKVTKETQDDLNQLKDRIGTLNSEIDAKAKTISSLKFAQDQLAAQMKSMTSNLAEEKTAVKLAESRAEKSNVLSQQLAKNLETATQEKQGLQETLSTLRTDLETAQAESAEAKKQRDEMQVALDSTQIALHEAKKAQKELGDENDTLNLLVAQYREKYGDLGGIAPVIPAVVKAVDPSGGLVVLSVGRDDKVQLGYEFTVFRGNNYVGKVKVIKVYPNLSGARIEWLKDGQEIQKGDKANTRIVGVN